HKQDLRLQVRRNSEGETHVHTARVVFDCCIEKPLDLGEGDYLIKLSVYLPALHSQYGTVEIYVLSSAQLTMKSGADFEQATDAAVEFHLSRSRFGNRRDDRQQSRFPRSIAAYYADQFTSMHLEVHILESPYFFCR